MNPGDDRVYAETYRVSKYKRAILERSTPRRNGNKKKKKKKGGEGKKGKRRNGRHLNNERVS